MRDAAGRELGDVLVLRLPLLQRSGRGEAGKSGDESELHFGGVGFDVGLHEMAQRS